MDTGSPTLPTQEMISSGRCWSQATATAKLLILLVVYCLVLAREKWWQFGHQAKNLIREFDAANQVWKWSGTSESKRVGKADIQKHQWLGCGTIHWDTGQNWRDSVLWVSVRSDNLWVWLWFGPCKFLHNACCCIALDVLGFRADPTMLVKEQISHRAAQWNHPKGGIDWPEWLWNSFTPASIFASLCWDLRPYIPWP